VLLFDAAISVLLDTVERSKISAANGQFFDNFVFVLLYLYYKVKIQKTALLLR
jgi:hypothetical protein